MNNLELLAKSIITNEIEPDLSDLETIIISARDLYHNGEEESFLTDSEYDVIELLLKNLDPENELLTQVGSDVRGGKIKLPVPMSGLDQIYETEISKWVKSHKFEDVTFVVTEKMDGTSALVHYKNHKQNISYSRGDGNLGADITRHTTKMPAIPQKVSSKLNDSFVRNEIIMSETKFDEVSKKAKLEGSRVYKNSRNYTAGKMNSETSNKDFVENVNVVAYQIYNSNLDKISQLELLEKEGFQIPKYKIFKGKDLNDEILTNLLNEWRDTNDLALDGIVIEVNDLDAIDNMKKSTSSSINPDHAKKYKVGSVENLAETEILRVELNWSKHGYLKPKLILKPVDLDGVTISAATGFNMKFIRDNNVGPGAIIKITRAGNVIPHVVEIVKESTVNVIPELSGSAYGELAWTTSGTDLYALNVDNNSEVHIGRNDFFFKKLEVPAIRESSIRKLYEAGFVTIESIVKASMAEIQNVTGESSGEKIYNGIKDKLSGVSMESLAAASGTLGIGLGERKLEKILEVYDNLFDLSLDDIIELDGFDTKTATLLYSNLPKLKEFLDKINGYYTIGVREKMNDSLENVVIVFTGIRDKNLEDIIKAKGGKVGSSFTSTTTHLVAKDPDATSGKLAKARAAGIEPISMETAWKMFGQ